MDDDSIFKGQWKDEIRQGYGISIWENGARYEGNWENDLFHGNGTYFFN